MNQFRLISFSLLICTLIFQACSDKDDNQDSTELLVLKPNAEEGVDAVIWTERPDIGSPDAKDFQAMGWTWYAQSYNGGIRRSLIDFNLESIPEEAKIINATLKLFHNPTSAEIPSTMGHSQRDGSNRSILSRVVSAWSEDNVTWNNQPAISTDNQVFVKASDAINEDYEIDVKDLVEDMIQNPSESAGFMYMLQNEEYYRAMIFASSDHENSDLHPELEIEYKLR